MCYALYLLLLVGSTVAKQTCPQLDVPWGTYSASIGSGQVGHPLPFDSKVNASRFAGIRMYDLHRRLLVVYDSPRLNIHLSLAILRFRKV